MQTKIATCSYCGTRAALVLTTRGRHELACASCGAPLHEMKPLKVEPARPPRKSPGRRAEVRPARPRRRKKGGFLRLLEEAWDTLEDIFD